MIGKLILGFFFYRKNLFNGSILRETVYAAFYLGFLLAEHRSFRLKHMPVLHSFLHFFGQKLKVYSSQAGALCCQLLFRTSCCEHSQMAFCLPCPSHASLMSGIKSWHFSLTSSYQYQHSWKETLISSCFPLRHPRYCFRSYCSNLLVISLRFGLWSSFCLWLCLSLTELFLSSISIHVFCQSTDLKSLSQLVILCLDYSNVPSAGLGKCSHGLLLSVQNDAANNLSCPFVLSSLHLPVDITHELYLLVFELPHELFSLSPDAISWMQKCQHQPPSSLSSCYIFCKMPLVQIMLSSGLVEAFWEHYLLSISCLQIQVLTKFVSMGEILTGWHFWLLVTICDIALLFCCPSHLPLSVCFLLS